MRVIAGQAKGRRLRTPKGRELRPTADRVKEALFNILPRDLTGWRVLDLFAGTGNLGLEALSRGAASAVMIDIARPATDVIAENIRTLGFGAAARVVTAPVFKAVRTLARSGEEFDLILLDPPYERGLAGETLKEIAKEGLLDDEGIVVAEHSVRDSLEERYGSLALSDRRRYGDTELSFFRSDAARAEE
ncbi:MAG TPA: 16S rRNA (guanine(966)-N(2))-methyltransferase RsmD [Candidatus Binatia bacterium]|jgi:16S rRNA (guanine(966)-N(2))-methyltransferase RsmD|nr:16S rRNA (guanine(966)-N(2))-methyltransferase RsmD [Candidatus Binatia bacterium]